MARVDDKHENALIVDILCDCIPLFPERYEYDDNKYKAIFWLYVDDIKTHFSFLIDDGDALDYYIDGKRIDVKSELADFHFFVTRKQRKKLHKVINKVIL